MASLNNNNVYDQSISSVKTNFENLHIEDERRNFIVDCSTCRKTFMISSRKRESRKLTLEKIECPNQCQARKFVIRNLDRTRHVQKFRGPGRPELWIDRTGNLLSPEERRRNLARTHKGLWLKARFAQIIFRGSSGDRLLPH